MLEVPLEVCFAEQYPPQRWTEGVTAATCEASSGDSGENEKSRADACGWARAAAGRRCERQRGQQEEEL